MWCKDTQSLVGTKTYQDIHNNFLLTLLPTPLCSAHWVAGRWPLQCSRALHPVAGTMHRDRRDWGTHGFHNIYTICQVRCVLSPSWAYARMVNHFWWPSMNQGNHHGNIFRDHVLGSKASILWCGLLIMSSICSWYVGIQGNDKTCWQGMAR